MTSFLVFIQLFSGSTTRHFAQMFFRKSTMSISQTIQNYWAGMAAYDYCHPPTVTSQWQALQSEASEFIESPSLVEAWDILHSAGRLFWKLTGIPVQLLAFPTVQKHAERYALTGCIRSQRNCEGRCCVISQDKSSTRVLN